MRFHLLRSMGSFIGLTTVLAAAVHAAPTQPVAINWLGGTSPALDSGVSFGVPWPRGQVQKNQAFQLTSAGGKVWPVQTWPLAFWPDGSLKWSGIATVAASAGPGQLRLSSTTPTTSPQTVATQGPTVRVNRSDTTIEVDTGRVRVRVPKWGTTLIDSITVEGREVARNGRLECILQKGPDRGPTEVVPREMYGTKLENVTVEQSGPVRAVLKLEGQHLGRETNREWLPFVVRLYLYAGQESVRMVHSFVFDGDDNKDFVRGLGVKFDIPMREQAQNRHVRFSGEGQGLWSEPIQPMAGRGGRFVANPQSGADVYPDQVEGQRVPNRENVAARGQGLLADWAIWDDFKLSQPTADGFTITKRTNSQSAWIPAGAGKRASGFAWAGDVSGGLGLSLKNFWQSYPATLEIQGASTNSATLRAWLWSPDAPAMDMRHYDTRAHGLDAVYEDIQPGFSTAHGVGRTSELTLWATSAVPTKDNTVKMAQMGAQPPLLVAAPKHLREAQAFGHWSLEDRSTPVKAAIEKRLDTTLNFYLKQPEQHNWYGFWDFGDVMHSYDENRHTWRYDLGGMAWANSELGPDMWLWYSFLRSGRADVFRMAEAMTRHTGEVDCYHLGRFAGLGSRHNVRHWGDGAKEARISQAAYRRFHFYLTTDERTGDLMREVVNADFKTLEYDPMRFAQPITEAERKIAPTRVRLGPDWFAFVGNWMTEWERTGDTKWRDKILAGVESLSKMPLGLRSGNKLVFGYDPATGALYQLNDQVGTYNLATIMGGAEVVFELNMMLDDARWQKLWLQYCRLYSAGADVIARDMKTGTEGAQAQFVRDGRLASYAYSQTKNEAFLKAGLDALLRVAQSGASVRTVSGPQALKPIEEGPGNTNSASQNGLETIAMLGLIGEHLPAQMPANRAQNQPPRSQAQRNRPGAGTSTPTPNSAAE